MFVISYNEKNIIKNCKIIQYTKRKSCCHIAIKIIYIYIYQNINFNHEILLCVLCDDN